MTCFSITRLLPTKFPLLSQGLWSSEKRSSEWKFSIQNSLRNLIWSSNFELPNSYQSTDHWWCSLLIIRLIIMSLVEWSPVVRLPSSMDRRHFSSHSPTIAQLKWLLFWKVNEFECAYHRGGSYHCGEVIRHFSGDHHSPIACYHSGQTANSRLFAPGRTCREYSSWQSLWIFSHWISVDIIQVDIIYWTLSSE